MIDHVGEPLFRQAQRWSWENAAGIGTRDLDGRDELECPDEVQDTFNHLETLVWLQGEATAAERVALAFELYRTMPCYSGLLSFREHYVDWGRDAHGIFWREYRSLISDPDDRLADPVGFSLWGDYFGGELVEEAWDEIARPAELSDQGLERVLEQSGPVLFRLKIGLYLQLAADRRWHLPIFRSLLASAVCVRVDLAENLDKDAARDLLRRLDLPKETEGLDDLKRLLESP